jgi:hypothetical protein
MFVRTDNILVNKRPRNFAEVVRQRELGIPDYVVNGNFLDEFYHAPVADRQSFLDTEPPQSSAGVIDKHDLALFAATAEKLANDYGLNAPAWVNKRAYCLAEPDIAGYAVDQLPAPLVRIMMEESPREFSKRNLFVSENLLTRM